MRKFTLLISFLLIGIYSGATFANDLYITNCKAHAYRNPSTNNVDVEFKARVCDNNNDWWGGSTYFKVWFYPNLSSRPSFPPPSSSLHYESSGYLWNYYWGWYYNSTCQDVTKTVSNLDWEAGVYNLYCVVDPENQLNSSQDSSENNNVYGSSSWVIGPDLYVGYFGYAKKGAELKYKFRVCNMGTHAAENFRVGIYFDRETPPMSGEYSDTFKSFTKLDPPDCHWRWGGVLECTPVCTEKDVDGDKHPDPIEVLRNPTPNGHYKSWLKADSGEFVKEGSEYNNLWGPLNINMANPDLVIMKFEAIVSENPPYSVTYNVAVCNKGKANSGVYWVDLYYHRDKKNPPTQGQPGDVHKGEPSLAFGELPTDEDYDHHANCVTHQFIRYNTPTGEYESYLQVDADDFVVDPDRVSNQKGPILVEVPKGSLPPGCPDNDEDGFGRGSDCPKDPLCVNNCHGEQACIDNCDVDNSQLDCDDDNNKIYPGAAEDCTDDVDQNCNGTANDGCPGVNCVDNDNDGVPGGPDCTQDHNDCDDSDPDRYPGATEVCGDNKDNDCDGYADDCCPGVNICDSDGDGACTGTDCTGPHDPECVAACNGNIECIDNCPPMKDPACVAACEGNADYDACVAACPDFKDPECVEACAGDQTCIDNCPPPQDGDDTNPDCGWAGSIEICGDHVDNDCDGIADDGCTGTFCTDDDDDGYGVGEGCTGPQDCDDANSEINPGASENCGDGIDDNCDWVPDGMCDTCVDTDGDGYWVGNGPDCADKLKDCNDQVSWIHPGGIEICGNDVDENCNLSITDTPCVDPSDAEECLALMPDEDAVEACLESHNNSGPPDNCLENDTSTSNPCHDPQCIQTCIDDCAAGVVTTCPSTLEDCINSCPVWTETCADHDGDGWGTGPGCPTQDCQDDPNHTGDNLIFPGAIEVCDGIDNDCDGTVDEWSATGGEECKDPECVAQCQGDQACIDICPLVDCVDHDGDGWGVGADCAVQDPDDNNPSTYPGSREICGDGIDQDGDGAVDNHCPICKDHDGDGAGVGIGCGAQLDCDDSNASIGPGVDETCGLKDINCDGKPPVAPKCAAATNGCSCKSAGGSNSPKVIGFPLIIFLLSILAIRFTRQ